MENTNTPETAVPPGGLGIGLLQYEKEFGADGKESNLKLGVTPLIEMKIRFYEKMEKEAKKNEQS